MVWVTGFPAPVFHYPSAGLLNTGFETAFAAADWVATGSAARHTPIFYRGVASCRFNPVAATGFIEQFQTLASVTGWKNTGNLEPWYVYFWARNDSGTGSFTVQIASRTSVPANVETQTFTFTLGTDITTDTTWRLYRAGPFTPTTYATVTQMYVKIGFTGATTAVLYLDEVNLCHAVDGQDFTEPLCLVTDFEIQKEYTGIVNRMEDGSVEGTQFTQGLYTGKWKTSPFTGVADVERYEDFFDYISDGTPYRIFNNQNDYTRDYVDAVKCPANPGSGLTQIQQAPYYEAAQSWEEVSREPRTPVQLYIKFTGLAAGAADVYFTTGAISGLSGANVYAVLDPRTVKVSGQKINPLDGSTEFPMLNFSVLDAAWAVTGLIKTNLERLYGSAVTLYEGTYGTAYGSFTAQASGYVGDFSGGADLTVNFAITSVYERLQKPVTPLTGGAQIREGKLVSDRTSLVWELQNPINLNINPAVNVLTNGGFESNTGATPTGWTDDGSNVLWGFTSTYPANARPYLGTNVCKNMDATGITTMRVITQDYANSKPGSTWTLSAAILSDTDPTGTFELKIIGLDSGSSPVAGESATTGETVRPIDIEPTVIEGFTRAIWRVFSITYSPINSAVVKVRVSIGMKQNTISTRAICADGVSLSKATLGYINREVVSINQYVRIGTDVGKAYVGNRGVFGTHPSTHVEKDQLVLFSPLRGHVCDVIRRLITSTTLGTNGDYDAGDGVGLGTYFPSTLINHTVFNTERAYTYTGAVPTLQSYDFTKYVVDIRFDSRCENLLNLLFDLCKAFYANLYVDSGGLLSIHFHRGIEVTDGSTLTPANLINEGKLFAYSFNRTEIVNQVRYRFDHEPSSETDSQGSSRGGGSKFLTELVFTEADMGDTGVAAPTSLTRAGLYEMEIETRAVRGSGSAQFGVSSYLYGNQIAYEVARRIITRNRFPSQTYSVQVPYSKRAVGLFALPLVTSNAMQDITSAVAGPPTRTATLMTVESQEIDYGRARANLTLRCLSDIADIPNSAAAAAPATPVSGNWKLVVPPPNVVQLLTTANSNPTEPADQNTILGEQLKDFKEYPRGYANIGMVILYYPAAAAYSGASTYNKGDICSDPNRWATAANGTSNPHNGGSTNWRCKIDGTTGVGNRPFTLGQGARWTNEPTPPNFTDYAFTRIYAVANGTPVASYGSPPAASEYQLVGELKTTLDSTGIPINNSYEAIVLYWGGRTGSHAQTLWVKIRYVNSDRVESADSDVQKLTVITVQNKGARYSKYQIGQVTSDGVRDTYNLMTRW